MAARETDAVVIGVDGLRALVGTLVADGRRVIGPVWRDGVIVLDDVSGLDDLARGVRDEQAPGRYRSSAGDGDGEGRFFGTAAPVNSPKSFLFPARQLLWRAQRHDGTIVVDEPPPVEARFAFVGVHPCDLAAIAVHDRVLLGGEHPDPAYASARADVFVLCAQCTHPASTCFCTSTGSGPHATNGYDLACTEIVDGATHEFVVEVGSDAGARMLGRIPTRPAREHDHAHVARAREDAAGAITRALPAGVRELLAANLEHARWDDVAARCLACGNCTMACPTCFCTTVTDATHLSTDDATRERHWDSCFALEHSFMHGGIARESLRARYRQWLTHKFSTWWDQFGTAGCVGCGRCITWCPVGIDVTEELAALTRPAEDAA